MTRTMTRTTGTAVTVEAVRRRTQRRRFIEFPYRLYRDDPVYVPPLRRDCRRLLSRRRNPFFEYGEVGLFLAYRGGRVAGRIAAVRNPRHNAVHGVRDGFFGQFECEDDPDAAVALVRAAERWLRGRGLTSIVGPVNFTTNAECGLLVDGFGTPPRVQMPYNPPYYEALLRHGGLSKVKDLWAWERDISALDARLLRVAEHVQDRHEITVRSVDLSRFESELARIKYVYDTAWERNWGFVPMTDAEFTAQSREFRKICDPSLVLLAEAGGEPVGVVFALPDLNQALPAARGRLTTMGVPIGMVRLARAIRRIDQARGVLLGVVPEYRNRGIEALLYARIQQALRNGGYRGTIELGWTLEDNKPIIRSLTALGCRHTKTYRLFRRDLTAGTGAAPEASPATAGLLETADRGSA